MPPPPPPPHTHLWVHIWVHFTLGYLSSAKSSWGGGVTCPVPSLVVVGGGGVTCLMPSSEGYPHLRSRWGGGVQVCPVREGYLSSAKSSFGGGACPVSCPGDPPVNRQTVNITFPHNPWVGSNYCKCNY